MHLFSGSRKHPDDVVADRVSEPDLQFPYGRQQLSKSTKVSEHT